MYSGKSTRATERTMVVHVVDQCDTAYDADDEHEKVCNWIQTVEFKTFYGQIHL